MDQYSLQTVFVNKILLEHSNAYYFVYGLWLLSCQRELSSCDRDCITHKINILLSGPLLTPALRREIWRVREELQWNLLCDLLTHSPISSGGSREFCFNSDLEKYVGEVATSILDKLKVRNWQWEMLPLKWVPWLQLEWWSPGMAEVKWNTWLPVARFG